MTPEQADRRIIVSRQTFHALAGAFGAGDIRPEALPGYRQQIAAEVVILEQIAAEHPGKAAKLADLIERYRAMARHMVLQSN